MASRETVKSARSASRSVAIARHNDRMELTPRLRLMNWLVSQGLTGLPENDLIRGFCERCCAEGLELSRGMVFIDTLHPIFEGRGFRWNDTETNESDAFEYGSTSEGEAAQAWRQFGFLSHARKRRGGDADRSRRWRFTSISDSPAISPSKVTSISSPIVHRFGEAGTMGQMDCVYSYWVTRRDDGFGAQGLAALRDLVPVLGACDQIRRAGRYRQDAGPGLSRARRLPSRCCAEKSRAASPSASTRCCGSPTCAARPRSARASTPDEIIPFLNDYAQASIDAIHEAGGDVLKLIGDGVLAMFTA